MNKTINLLKLLPVVLLSACTTSYPPQDTTSAPELPHRNVLVQQPDNCSVGCPQGGSQQTIYRHVYTLNNNSATKFANWVAYSVTKTSQASGRPRNWAQDPDLPPSDTLAPSAYKNAHTLLKVDRGQPGPVGRIGRRIGLAVVKLFIEYYAAEIRPESGSMGCTGKPGARTCQTG